MGRGQFLIAGGGIGGLTTALALHRIGAEVTVFETVHDISPLGVGINLLPHAVRVLSDLGVEPQLADIGLPTAELIYFSKHGKLIWREPRGRDAGYPWPQYSVHRGRLQLMLLEVVRSRLGPNSVRTGHHVQSFEANAGQVKVVFVDRRTDRTVAVETGDALIGADGIHSEVRRAFYPQEGSPPFSGRMLWRAVSEAPPFLTGRTMIMAGHANQKFVAYPIAASTRPEGLAVINWIAELNLGREAALPKRDWNRRVEKEKFAPAFESWRFDWLDVPAIIAAAQEVFEFPMVDRDPLKQWTFGRVTLLGDAAHPMYPIGSNGASQAIVDAASLAEELQNEPDVEKALRNYESRRLGPTSAIVLRNRQMGPEIVMQMAEDRAPNGFDVIDNVISRAELEEIANSYKITAGFDLSTLNRPAERK